MASPSIQGTPAGSSTDAAVTSFAFDLPTGIQAGELLVAFVSHKDNASGTSWAGSGFTFLKDVIQGTGSTSVLSVGYRWADGTEGATDVVGCTIASRFAVVVYRTSGAENPATQPPEASTGSPSANQNAPDPDSLAPTGGSKDYLFVAAYSMSHGGLATTYPTNYTLGQITLNSGGTQATRPGIGVAARQLTAASDDPSPYTTDGSAAAESCAVTVAIHPAAAGGQEFTRTSDDAAGIVDTASRLQEGQRTQPETLGLADPRTIAQTAARDRTDALGLLDGGSFELVKPSGSLLGITDSITVDLQGAAGQDFFRTADDVIGLVDSAGQQSQASQTTSDALGGLDAIISGLAAVREPTDALGLVDEIARLTTAVRDLVEALSLSDEGTYDLTAPSDALGLTDDAVAELTGGAVGRLVTDALALTDTATGVQGAAREEQDGLALADLLEVQTGFVRTLTDVLGATDTTARTVQAARSLADALGLTDPISSDLIGPAPQQFTREVTETLGLLDVSVRAAPAFREQSDALGLDDEAAQLQALSRLVAEALGLADDVDALMGVPGAPVLEAHAVFGAGAREAAFGTGAGGARVIGAGATASKWGHGGSSASLGSGGGGTG